MNSYKIGIALMGKGSTNNLHTQELVDEFSKNGIEVRFFVRGDYMPLLNKIPGCNYSACRFTDEKGMGAFWRGLFSYIRSLYPSSDIGFKSQLKIHQEEIDTVWQRVYNFSTRFLARYKFIMRLLVWLEEFLYRSVAPDGFDSDEVDQLLLLGLGVSDSKLEGALTWWAKRNGISVVHMVGNYENLSSKGYRGVPIDKLVVWGQSMHDDAIYLQDIPSEKISLVGSLRYNRTSKIIDKDKETFFKACDLDPEKRTMLFAGSLEQYHYFEMLEIFKYHLNKTDNCQMIFRVYPNKALMNSPYMEPLLEYAEKDKNIFISLADENYRSGARDGDVLQIEEAELWHSLAYCDVVVNFLSTISIEACIFDKPVINMFYYQPKGKLMLRAPIYYDFPNLFHHRKLSSYGAIKTATNREKLIEMIEEAFRHPEIARDERKTVVEKEIGIIDGKAPERLVKICVNSFNNHNKLELY